MTAIVIDSKCAKCGGTITDDGERPVCINCGYEPLAKPAPGVIKNVEAVVTVEKRPNNPEKARVWFHKHLQEVQADLLAIGNKATCEKWGIKHQMVSHIKSSRPAAKNTAAAPGSAPQLPAFSDSWQPEVQIKWLDVWLAIRSLK